MKKETQYILLFLIFFALIKIFFFIDFEPRTDQAHQIGWIYKIVNSTHFLGKDVLIEPSKIFYDFQGLIYEIFKPTFFYGNLHANYFHLAPILIASFLTKISSISPIFIFNFLSIISSFFCFYFLIKILMQLYYDEIKKNLIFFILIFFSFCFLNWYGFIFSQLGVHNISSLVILLNFYYYLNLKNLNFFNLGAIFALSSLFHQINFIILFVFYTLILIEASINFRQFIKNFIYFLIIPTIFFIPLIFIIFFNLENYNFFLTENINSSNKINLILMNLIFFIKKNTIFFSTIFLLTISNYFFKIKNLLEKKIRYLNIFLIICSILINEFYVQSYHRFSVYLFYIYVILSFAVIIELIKKKFLKQILILLIFINIFYNFIMISNNYKGTDHDTEFYTYYNNQGNISSVFKEINNDYLLDNIIFLNNLSEDYYNIYNKVDKNKLLVKPIYNHIVNDQYKYLQDKLDGKDVYLLSIIDNNILFNNVILKLNNNDYFKCVFTNAHYEKKLFMTGKKSYYYMRIDRFNC